MKNIFNAYTLAFFNFRQIKKKTFLKNEIRINQGMVYRIWYESQHPQNSNNENKKKQ